jgi:peptidyl-dipeptidase Dcp
MPLNPFFEEWDNGYPPFDRILPEHFAPALDAAMAENLAEIEAITAQAPSFGATIEGLERSGRALGRVGAVFSNLVSSVGGDALNAIDLEYSPKLAKHSMQVALNPALFERVDTVFRQRHSLGLAEDQMRLLERRHLRFIRSGAALGPAEKARMSEISERLAVLHTQFGQNVLHDEKAWQLELSEADLAGLPAFVREGARQAAAERGLPGRSVMTLSRSLIEPFLTFSARRDLRRIAHEAWVARGAHPGEHDNRVLIPEILRLRAERARLLGYDSYADFRLADTMAGSQAAVAELTDQVWVAGRRKAGEECARLQAVARADGFNDEIAAWDWAYYAERVRQREYAIDEAEVKPYFVFENIQQAAFDTASRLFGLSFTERPDLPVYHPDVRVYDVRDAEGPVGIFIADPFARPDKRSGAWMSSFQDQESLDGEVLPIIVNNNNFARGTPTLLSFTDAETLFHEFGHGLHGLLSKVRYPSQSGTSVRQDFVELPSQIYEHWISVPSTLATYARHYETDEPIPEALVTKLLAAQTFNQGFGTVEYTASAILDMALHAHPAPEDLDIAAFEQETLARIEMPAEIGPRHRPPHFQHLFAGSGYAAGYYSYLWAEVLDADGFEAFEEAGDPFDAATAARLRTILAAGDTRDPMELYVAFRGHAPRTEPLLKNRGLVA